MAESEMDQVIGMLRACLLSTKGGIPLSNLDRDYKMIVGTRIPFQKLGFQSLEQFLKSIPNVSISCDRNGQMILDAIPTKKSAHLAALVQKQKSAPKRPARYLPPRRTAASSWRPPPSAASAKPSKTSSKVPLSVTVNNKFGNKNTNFKKSSRLVSFSNSTPPTTNTNTRSSYEKPPRFLKLDQENQPSAPVLSKPENQLPAPVPSKPVITTPASVAAVTQVPVQPAVKSMSRAQDRLQRIASSTKNQSAAMPVTNESLMTSGVLNNRDITASAPAPALQARLNAVFRKAQELPLEDKFSSFSLAHGEDYEKLLEEYASYKGMSRPVFKLTARKSQGRISYFSSVKIDDLTISSYPDDRPSAAEARQLAAKQALDELMKLNSVTSRNVIQDKNIIMSRITEIVNQHPCGIWSMQIPIEYNDKFQEPLPDEWIKIMARCPLVSMDYMAENRIILSPHCPVSPTEQISPALSDTTSVMQAHHRRPAASVPDPICLPKDDAWDVYVTCGNSTDEVWVRLIGAEYSVKYENLATDMEMFYMGGASVAPCPEVDMFYAIKMDDCWFRVKVTEINEAGTEANVFFIDHGDEEQVELKELHVLEQRFVKLPAQAVLCYLWGLEELVDDPHAEQHSKHIIDAIVGKTFIASLKSRPSSENPAVGVILYDTSTDEDLNMNTILLEKICKEASAPQLPPEGKVKELLISHITDTGDIYLQFDTYCYVQTLVSNLLETDLKSVTKGINSSSANISQLYLAQNPPDGNFCRVVVTKRIDAHKVEVLFVDIGSSEVINQSDLIVLDARKKSITDFPYQAVKVNLQNVPPSSFNEQLAQRIRVLVPSDERILVKTISFGRSTNILPVVDIFKRIQPDNLLVSISETLAYEIDLKPSDDIRGRKRLERLQSLTSTTDAYASTFLHSLTGSDLQNETRSSRGLSPPQIPDIGNYFDVHVTMAANPGNFTVQPHKDSVYLKKMMAEMQSHYNEHKYPKPSADSVQEGGLFAALHSDGYWYRVCVSNIIVDNMISVYFCDFGDVSVLTVDKLQPLTHQFKELPYQAIKAKLAGIEPMHSDWSVEDCLMFQDLVVGLHFVSVIKETGPDLLNPSDTVIGLELIDTSGEDDINIAKLLVAQERAIFSPVS